MPVMKLVFNIPRSSIFAREKTPGLELTFVSANGRKEIDGILVVLRKCGPQPVGSITTT